MTQGQGTSRPGRPDGRPPQQTSEDCISKGTVIRRARSLTASRIYGQSRRRRRSSSRMAGAITPGSRRSCRRSPRGLLRRPSMGAAQVPLGVLQGVMGYLRSTAIDDNDNGQGCCAPAAARRGVGLVGGRPVCWSLGIISYPFA